MKALHASDMHRQQRQQYVVQMSAVCYSHVSGMLYT